MKSKTDPAKAPSFQIPILIFTDGACSGNPGPGGWAAIVAFESGEVFELGGSAPETTNNRMEMLASIKALESVQNENGAIFFFTDSTYVIRGITQWIWAWKRKGWINGEGNEVQNKDLWLWLHDLVLARDKRGPGNSIEWYYSRGHIGTPGNERCDEIAVAFSKGKRPTLYRGSLLKYPISIYDLPEDTALPEMKPKQEKKAAFSYLSYHGGVVYRHRDWSSCEKRVKGVSGAKFKKALAESDERKILQEWGLAANTKIQE